MNYSTLQPIRPKMDFKKDFYLDPSQYLHDETEKTQICLHHTASGPGVNGDYKWWVQNTSRIATHFIIARDGTIYLMFPEKNWAHHLGVKQWVFKKANIKNGNNPKLNMGCIGIEIDSWGPLYEGEKFANAWTGTQVGYDKVTSYTAPFKTIPSSPFFESKKVAGKPAHLYEAYTEDQIAATYRLVSYLSKKYEIPIEGADTQFSLSKSALTGKPGLYTHNSYRPDKQDIHPQPEMVDMLLSLKNQF